MDSNISDDRLYEILVEAQEPKERNHRLVYYYWNHVWLGFDESGGLADERRANLVHSCLSGIADVDGERVDVVIYRYEGDDVWRVDLVMPNGLSMTWQDQFETDEQAFELFVETVGKTGVESLARLL